MSELTIAYDEGELIGILIGTGGISDMAKEILAASKRQTGARVVYEADARNLVRRILEVYRTEHHSQALVLCDEGRPCANARKERTARAAETAK